jgi:hypothetical protein
VQTLDRRKRPRVWGHQTVCGRESCDERQSDEQQRQPLAPCHREHDRSKQHEADAEEHRQPENECHGDKAPVDVPDTHDRQHSLGDGLRAAGFRQQLADDGPEADDNRNEAEGVAHAFLERSEHRAERHPGNHTQEERRQRERDEGMQSHPRDEGDQTDNRGDRPQQERWVRLGRRHTVSDRSRATTRQLPVAHRRPSTTMASPYSATVGQMCHGTP